MATTFISPIKERDARLLSHQPRTEYEVELQQALRRSNGLINQQKEWLMAMQAQNILQDMYTRRLRTQLEYQEEKAAGKKSTRLHVDGHPRLLTNAAFIELVEQSRQKKEEEEAKAARKKDAKTHAQKQLTSALLKWEAECQKIEEDNTKEMEKWETSVEVWKKEQELARTERRKPHWTKPVKPTYTSGVLVKPPTKPKLGDFVSSRRTALTRKRQRANGNEAIEPKEDDSDEDSDEDDEGDGLSGD
ncbi:hypothetical protein LENED_010733 [Lentinula edodes]|uniref:Uncharacterized protein n=1 Tax=Lentinula edodes TaxID=5353 RepID=A0A1Q3EN69_LENED|nr:hypothetical protein LENED_010733 [Lentinula edodes]